MRSTPAKMRPPAGRRRLLIGALGVLVALAAVVDGPRVRDALRERQLARMSAAQLAEVVRRRPDDLAARYQWGLALARAGDNAAGTRELLAVLSREPGRADVLNDLGVLYLLQERYYEALVALDGAVAARPEYGRAFANLGRLYLATKMPYTALRQFQRAVRLGAADAPTLCDLGNAYQQTLNFRSARRVYERALRGNPRSAAAWLGLARADEGLTEEDGAIAAARRALQLRPRDPAAMAALGHLQLLRAVTPAELQAVRGLLAAAVAGDPSDPEARYDLGRCWRRLGNEREAIAVLRAALRLSPDHPGAAYQLSQALIASGRVAEGERVGAAFRRTAARSREQDRLEERVFQQPGDLTARLQLARLYAEERRSGLALLQCRQILNADPSHAEARRLAEQLARSSGG